MSGSHCDSADVRPSRQSLELDRIGLHRYRCRACGGHFWLRQGQIEAVRARRREYFVVPPGEEPASPRTTALPVALAALGEPPADLAALDRPADIPPRAPDLRALDLDLVRRRAGTPPR